MRDRWDRRALVVAGVGGLTAALAGCTGPGDPTYRIYGEAVADPASGTPVVDWTDSCLDEAPTVISTVRRAVGADDAVSSVLSETEYERVDGTIRGCPHPPDGDAPGLLQGLYVRVDATTVRGWTGESRPG